MTKLTFAAVLVLIAGCGPNIRVYSDYDREYNLEAYTTFNWGTKINIESGNNPLYYNELNDKRIKNAVQEQLLSKGYALTEDKPDLIVHYHIVVDDQSIVTTEPYGYAYGPYWLRAQTNIYPYREGTLIVDLMEPKTNSLIWRGWAVSAVDTAYTPEQIDNLIKKAVAKIFKSFPEQKSMQSKQKSLFRTDNI